MQVTKVNSPKIKWLEEDLPYSEEFQDTYYSKQNGLDESSTVFIKASQLMNKWKAKNDSSPFVIAELGFGTGLNYLLVQNAWKEFLATQAQINQKPLFQLHYFSVEKYPLNAIQIKRALDKWKNQLPGLEELVENLPLEIKGIHRFPIDHELKLTLVYDDVEAFIQSTVIDHVDVWFCDGFAPSRNEKMWNDLLYEQMAVLSGLGSEVVTFSAAGHVRRGLEKAGFQVERLKGYGTKKERIKAIYQGENNKKRFQSRVSFRSHQDSVCIIGGGIAGCTLAHALSKRGIAVEIFEKDTLGFRASGNEMAIVTPHIGMPDHPISVYTAFAFDYFKKMAKKINDPSIIQKKGLLQIAYEKKILERFENIKNSDHYPHHFVSWLDQEEASRKIGHRFKDPSLFAFIEDAYCVRPRKLCQWLIEQSKARIQKKEIKEIYRQDHKWVLKDSNGTICGSYTHVIIANAVDALKFDQSAFLPLQRLKGQVDLVEATKASERLSHILSYEGYLTPAFELEEKKVHLLGATHERGENLSEHPSYEASLHLKNQCQKHLGDLQLAEVVSSRASVRTMSPDNLPVVGQLPDQHLFHEAYSELHHGKKIYLDQQKRDSMYLGGLFSLLALGSRGFTTSFLSAELISDQIQTGKKNEFEKHINADRFLMRKLKRPPSERV